MSRSVTSHAAGSPWPEPQQGSPLTALGNCFSDLFPSLPSSPAEPPPLLDQTEFVDERVAEGTTTSPPPVPEPLSKSAAGIPSLPRVTPTLTNTLALSFASMPPTKANSHKLAGAGYYLTWREQMVKEVENGKKPPPELLTLLEASLYKLSDDDLRDEYRWYAERYMHDESEIMRAACEMIVIHIGEVVNMPQGARVDKRRHNKRLCAAQVTPRAAVDGDDGSDDAMLRAGGPDFEAYKALRDGMLATRSSGGTPSAEQYAEVDVRLMLLHMTDMVDEYAHPSPTAPVPHQPPS